MVIASQTRRHPGGRPHHGPRKRRTAQAAAHTSGGPRADANAAAHEHRAAVEVAAWQDTLGLGRGGSEGGGGEGSTVARAATVKAAATVAAVAVAAAAAVAVARVAVAVAQWRR